MNSVNTVSNSIISRVDAAARVFDDYGNFIRCVVQSYIRDEDQAWDLFQNFFLSLILNPLPVDVENVEGYLYKAITNSIIDANRRTGRYLDFMRTHVELSDDSADQKTSYELLVQEEEAKRVFELIENRLPHGEAQALTLRYREQYTTKEAAEKMGVSDKTLRAYISEGLSRIRRLLKNIEARATE